MNDREDFSFNSSDGLQIACYRWPHSGRALGVFQIAHGIGEHARRYDSVAEILSAAGFEVYANDHRGHGRTAKNRAELGDLGAGGWDALVADILMLTEIVRSQHPQRPVILLGQSAGSFAVQELLLDYSQLVAGVVLSGSAALDQLQAALASGELISFNQDFEPARTPYDWLSRNPGVVDEYISDPLCRIGIDPSALKALSNAAARLADTRELSHIRSDLPVYILAGDKDPINHHLDWVKILAERYRGARVDHVMEKYYAGGRHEMLNEINRDEVMKDLLNWALRIVA